MLNKRLGKKGLCTMDLIIPLDQSRDFFVLFLNLNRNFFYSLRYSFIAFIVNTANEINFSFMGHPNYHFHSLVFFLDSSLFNFSHNIVSLKPSYENHFLLSTVTGAFQTCARITEKQNRNVWYEKKACKIDQENASQYMDQCVLGNQQYKSILFYVCKNWLIGSTIL